MGPATILALALCGTAAMPAVAAVAVTGHQPDIVPTPTAPAEPRTPTDVLLRTALAEVVKEPREFIVPTRGPVLLLRNGPHVSAHILPADTSRGIAILTADELEALATHAGTDHYSYLAVRVLSMDAQQAVVNVQLFPAISKGSIALCCWTIDRRYRRTAEGWTFDRLVGGGVY